jgi:hypothetical protein
MGLKQSSSAPGLFYLPKVIINLYVDDLPLVGIYEIVRNTMQQMTERFSAKGNFCGDSFAYIGVAIHRQWLKK